MKKLITWLVVVIVIIGGAYLILHKSSKQAMTGTSSNSAPAVNNAVLLTKSNASLGQYLTDPSGKALYTYNADASGVSNCTGSCLATWPAYQDKGSTTNLPTGISTLKRTDNGQIQFTYVGMPLYYFLNDKPGQVTGNGVDNFQVAKPASASSSQPSSTSSGSSNSSSGSSSSPSSNYPY